MKLKKLSCAAVALVLFAAPELRAQVTSVYLPDANAGAGVAANMIPFSSVFGPVPGAWTHLTIIPASVLASHGVLPGDRLLDIQFAPCGSGTITMPSVQVLAGHLVSPIPTFSLANAFADQSLVYDSSASGPHSFSCVANAWSSLGVGGGNFAWDGVRDVGIYTSHAGLTINSTSGWQGSFWRDSALMRHYVNAYQATMALTSALSGLKIGLVFANPFSAPASLVPYGQPAAGGPGFPSFVATEMPTFGNPWFGVGVVNALPGAIAVLIASSGAADVPIGAGVDVRLAVDLSFAAASFMVAMPVNGFGIAYFPAPVPQYFPGLAGLTVFCQGAIVGDPNAPMTLYGIPLALTSGLAITPGL
jgi:hypothetical protein